MHATAPARSRRGMLDTALRAAGLTALARAAHAGAARGGAPAPPAARDGGRFAEIDAAMEELVARRGAPGAQFALAIDGRLVHARGYGWADRDAREPVSAVALFRIASLSKSITGVTIVQLAERSQLSLDARVCEVLALPPRADPRWRRVTIWQLLHHTGGWDRARGFDPMFEPVRIARAMKLGTAPDARQIIDYMLGRPLDFDPGSRYAYSNFGYCLLGRVIERVTGTSYEERVRRAVLEPLGIRRMRLGRTALSLRAPGEVRYYVDRDRRGQPLRAAAPAGAPLPYGPFPIEPMDSHGGWIACAPELVRFAGALDVHARSPLLDGDSMATLFAPFDRRRGRGARGEQAPGHYGCGWRVRDAGNGAVDAWHTGSLDGTSTLLVRGHDGRSWAALFNERNAADGRRYSDIARPLLQRAVDRVRAVGLEGDRFGALL